MAERGDKINIEIAYSPRPREVLVRGLRIDASASVMQALRSSGLLADCPELDLTCLTVSVWGRKTPMNQALREGDRIELCRPLVVDPKVARRERFAKQGARGTGLFAQRRAGAKAGYGA
ncbi:RnfH family protein [Curvibacter sp. RS43]|uniref:RnfH family protein n=1 Tax=Curvibacter microcysteis TaxID=3026419 RepID=UPI002362AF3A|nr:RnfH family protein [Curvibacter sp. RS43]MDD0809953.1 RnfH family protein [Curvibacter sp. RS43]